MMDKSEVMKALEICATGRCTRECPYISKKTGAIHEPGTQCGDYMQRDALELLRGLFSPDEVCYILVDHGQHDFQFKLGDTISYTPSEVRAILKQQEARHGQ